MDTIQETHLNSFRSMSRNIPQIKPHEFTPILVCQLLDLDWSNRYIHWIDLWCGFACLHGLSRDESTLETFHIVYERITKMLKCLLICNNCRFIFLGKPREMLSHKLLFYTVLMQSRIHRNCQLFDCSIFLSNDTRTYRFFDNTVYLITDSKCHIPCVRL